MIGERRTYSGYVDTFDGVVAWCDQMRKAKQNIKLVDKRTDKDLTIATRETVLAIFPQIEIAIKFLKEDNQIVYRDNPVESFPNSPYSRLHINLQQLRRVLVAETLERVENFRDVPESVSFGLNAAWQEVVSLPEPKAPTLDLETLNNMAQFPQEEVITWARFVDGFTSCHELVKRSLANKYQYSRAHIQGYNIRSVQLIEAMLTALDTLGSCTAWQLRWDKQAYLDRVKAASYAFVSEKTHVDTLTGEGKMWSDERLYDPDLVKWIEALEIGEVPAT